MASGSSTATNGKYPNGSMTLLDDARQFQLLVNSVVDYAIYMLDREGHIASWNPGGERIKGYRAEEVIGRHFSMFYTPDDATAGEPGRALRTAAETGRYEAENWRMRRDGTRFWASVVIDPVRRDGELIGFAKVTRDISERREAQQAVEDAHRAMMIDGPQFEAALPNLVVNARDAIPAGGDGLIGIRTRCVQEAGKPDEVAVAVAVSDSGEGMQILELLRTQSGRPPSR